MTDLEQFARHAAPELPGCQTLIITDTVIRVAQKLCDTADILREIVSVTTVVDTREYALTVSLGHILSRVLNVKTEAYPRGLAKTNETEADQSSSPGIPSAFYVDGYKELCLVPTPSKMETVAVIVTVKPDWSSEQLDDALYNTHLDLIMAGVKSKLMIQPGKEWSNETMAAYYKTQYENGLAAARIATHTGNVGGSLRVAPRKF